MKIWAFDEKIGISCGINDDGNLFLGDDRSGCNLRYTEDNIELIKTNYFYYTGKEVF